MQLLGKCDHPRLSDRDWAWSLCRIHVTIPDSVTQIGFQAFAGCIALTLVVPITRIQLGVAIFPGFKQVVLKECECQECEYMWFLNGWVCPRRWRSNLLARGGWLGG